MSERQFCPNHYRASQNTWITEVWRGLWSLSSLISPAYSRVSYNRFLRTLSSSILNISKDGNGNISGQSKEGKRRRKAGRQGVLKKGNFPSFVSVVVYWAITCWQSMGNWKSHTELHRVLTDIWLRTWIIPCGDKLIYCDKYIFSKKKSIHKTLFAASHVMAVEKHTWRPNQKPYFSAISHSPFLEVPASLSYLRTSCNVSTDCQMRITILKYMKSM